MLRCSAWRFGLRGRRLVEQHVKQLRADVTELVREAHSQAQTHTAEVTAIITLDLGELEHELARVLSMRDDPTTLYPGFPALVD